MGESNRMADTKYLPFATQYMGMAHGNGYEHLKRWLKNRLIFTDTLYDYAPSYNNDVLTIRANTTEPMTITIETYTPVYQHLSWYNNQMDKKKIDGKIAITFTGTAQTATDQEVLIYGGSNIKRITGISSMNPNSMLIGSATRLIELDVSNCPILATVNATGSNFTPHTYLNKLDISNCPKLTGTLRINNSPLLRELNAKGTGIDTLQLAPSLRNLEVLRLPNTVTELTLNDAGLLNTLEFDEGGNLQRISLSNCPGIANSNIDLTKVPTVLLDNSYNAQELYMSATTNLTVKNMPDLERVIYIPNNEYETFDITTLTSSPDYSVTTFNCPRLTTFMTTAPHRESYGLYDLVDKEVIINLLDSHTLTNNQFINSNTGENGTSSSMNAMIDYISVNSSENYKLDCTSTVPCTMAFYDSNKSFISSLPDGANNVPLEFTTPSNCSYIRFHVKNTITSINSLTLYKTSDVTIVQVKDYGDIKPNTTFTANSLDLSNTQFTDIKFLCTTDLYNLKVPTTMKNFYCDSAMDIDTEVVTEASYEVIHDELVEQYTTNYSDEVYRYEERYVEGYSIPQSNWQEGYQLNNGQIQSQSVARVSDFFSVSPNTSFIAVSTGVAINQVPYTGVSFYDENKNHIQYLGLHKTVTVPTNGRYARISLSTKIAINEFTINYTGIVSHTPNIIPSSASGSLIFNLYSNNTTQPTSTSPYMWDLTGLKLNDFYTFGMNNQIVEMEAYREINPDLLSICQSYAPLSLNNLEYFELHRIISKIKLNYLQNVTVTSDTGTNLRIAHNNGRVIDVTSAYLENVDTLFIAYNYNTNNPNYITINAEEGVYRINPNSINNVVTNNEIITITSLELTPNTYTKVCDGTGNITMPQRLPGYSIRMVNADITPNNYANHLYPLLVDTTLPITGKLDYSKYKGTSLAWAYAYTTNDVAITPLDSRHMGGITNEYNKLYGTDYVDIVDVWAYKDDDFSNKNTNEAITKAYIELTSSNYTTRIDEVLQWYPNCTDLYLFDDGSVTDLANMLNSNNTTHKNQIANVTFMDNYFDNLTNLNNTFREMKGLVSVTNIPNGVTNMKATFLGADKFTTLDRFPNNVNTLESCFAYSVIVDIPQIPRNSINMSSAFNCCSKLNCVVDLSNVTVIGNLNSTFYSCSSLTYPPILPSNYTGSMNDCFNGCSSLVEAPVLPNGVTNMNSTFKGCSSLTTAPNIPNGVTNMLDTFNGCKVLTTAPTIPQGVTNMNGTFNGCSVLTTVPNIPSGVINMDWTFNACKSLTTTPNIPDSVTSMANTFSSCSSLTTAPTIPNGVTNMNNIFSNCSKLTECTIPLPNVINYTNCLLGCSSLTNITWTGERTTDFSLTTLGAPSYTQADIQELVPEHLGTVESATLTLGATYLAYLTEEEIASAVAKGWTLQ